MKYITYNLFGRITSYVDTPNGVPPKLGNVLQVTDEQYSDCIQNPRKWMVKNGSLTPWMEPDSAEREAILAPVRKERDRLLLLTDWTQIPDNPIDSVKKSDWAKYRQSLRDLPNKTQDIYNITWPAPPQDYEGR